MPPKPKSVPFTLNHLDLDVLYDLDQLGLKLLFKDDIKNKQRLMNNCTSICSGINIGYIKDKVKKSMQTNKYDILAIESNTGTFYGFMITEQGGCNHVSKYRNVPVLSLVCSSPDAKQANISPARVMMYTYLIALKKQSIKYGILDLASTYNNISGYCLYKKFGFDENMELKQCLNSKSNLPMIVDVDNITENELWDLLFYNTPFRRVDVLCDEQSKIDSKRSTNIQSAKQLALEIVQNNMTTYSSDELQSLQNELDERLKYIKSDYTSEQPLHRIYDINNSDRLYASQSPLRSRTPTDILSILNSELSGISPMEMFNMRSNPNSRSRSRSRSRSSSLSGSPRRMNLTRRKSKNRKI